MKNHGCTSSLLFISFLLCFCLNIAKSTDHRHVEDFTSTQYKDDANTNAFWDVATAELKLHPFEVTLAGSYDTPGTANHVAVSGDYAYVADDGSGLQVIDISNPTNPTVVGSYNTSGEAKSVSVSGNYVYIADGTAGMQIIDISDPTNPTLAATFTTQWQPQDVDISGDYAYLACYYGDLLVVDISDPTSPTLEAGIDPAAFAMGVAVSGDYAYVTDRSNKLLVIDISDPSNPTSAGSCNTPSNAYGVTIWGDYAYVANYTSGLQIIDISDPTNPTSTSSYNTPHYAYNVAVCGDYAYVADGNSGLHVIDISDPTHPSLIDSYDTPGSSRGVAVSGKYAYTADGTSGLQVIDIGDIFSPALAGHYDTAGEAKDIAVNGDYAYVADGTAGMQVIDISDPTNPTLAGTFTTQWQPQDVDISGDYAYLACYYGDLLVVDINDPTSPSLTAGIDPAAFAMGVAVSGDYAYVTDRSNKLLVIDISDPSNPTSAGSCNTPSNAYGVTIWGDYAYVANYSSGLQIIDISDPTSPVLAGSFDTPGYTYDVAVSGDYAYLADYASGLQIVDISIPTNPTLASNYDTPGHARGVAICGDHAYVGDESCGMQIIDISDPSSPSLIDSYDTPGSALGLTISGDHAYVADWTSGLQVIKVFERLLNNHNNIGQSSNLNALSDDILHAKITSTQVDSISWALSADNGTHWEQVAPDGNWHSFNTTGADLLWRSTHTILGTGDNPACSSLEIEWLYEFAVIDSIRDIPNDQGRQVRISWSRSGHDFVGSSTPIIEYAIYRKIDPNLTTTTNISQPEKNISDLKNLREYGNDTSLYPPGSWDFLMTVPADCEDHYAAVVPTLADSTIDDGMYFTPFFVRARTAVPGNYFDSKPDSSYSVDNLPPSSPTGLAASVVNETVELSWDESLESDLDYYVIFRDESRYDSTRQTQYVDSNVDVGQSYRYKITAVDVNANESGFSNEVLSGPITIDLISFTAVAEEDRIHLRWETAVEINIAGFNVLRSKQEGVEFQRINSELIASRGESTFGAVYDYIDFPQENAVYLYKLEYVSLDGGTYFSSAITIDFDTGVLTNPTAPKEFVLYQNYPNPFNPQTSITFDLPKPVFVQLVIYNILGENVRSLVEKHLQPGTHTIIWDGLDQSSVRVPSGIYLYRISAGDFTCIKKLAIAK